MVYTLSYQMYKYEHGVSAAEQRAADFRAGEGAAALRDLRVRLGRVFRGRAFRGGLTHEAMSSSSVPLRRWMGQDFRAHSLEGVLADRGQESAEHHAASLPGGACRARNV